MDIYQNIKQSEKGVWLSISCYLFLAVVKIGAGSLLASKALFADGLNNTTDIIASVAVLIGLKISRKPPDDDHPYGHFRAETISALIASFIMATVGLQVLYQAVSALFTSKVLEAPSIWTAWIALIAAIFMYGVYRYNKQLAEKNNSMALMAAAKDNFSDALVSVGVAVGIFGAQFGLPWLDIVTALIVGLIICKTAWDIFRDATHSLTDGFDEEKLERLRHTVANTPGVVDIKDIRARVHGSRILLDVIIMVNPELSLSKSHDISDEIERRMFEKHNIAHAHIHVEPYENDDATS